MSRGCFAALLALAKFAHTQKGKNKTRARQLFRRQEPCKLIPYPFIFKCYIASNNNDNTLTNSLDYLSPFISPLREKSIILMHFDAVY